MKKFKILTVKLKYICFYMNLLQARHKIERKKVNLEKSLHPHKDNTSGGKWNTHTQMITATNGRTIKTHY